MMPAKTRLLAAALLLAGCQKPAPNVTAEVNDVQVPCERTAKGYVCVLNDPPMLEVQEGQDGWVRCSCSSAYVEERGIQVKRRASK